MGLSKDLLFSRLWLMLMTCSLFIAPHSAFVYHSCHKHVLFSKKMHLNMIFGAFSTKKVSQVPVETLKQELLVLTNKCQPNGVYATPQQKHEVNNVVAKLEKQNPTKSPALSKKMEGFWQLVYSDFTPPAPSSGKLGPFVGAVFQDLEPSRQQITNLLDISFPPIRGGLVANQSIKDPQTWQIEFQRIGNYFAGLKIQSKTFQPGEIRLWKITYLDDDFRILRAGKSDDPEKVLFIFQKAKASRFEVKI